MTALGFQPPAQGESELVRVEKLKTIQRGKLNSSTNGTVTLTANSATTTVAEPLCSANSRVYLSPQTQTASEDQCSAAFWVVPGDQQFVINHPNRSETDRTFGYDCLG